MLALQPNLFFTLLLGGNAKIPLANFRNSQNLILVAQPSMFFSLFWGGNAIFSLVNFWNSHNICLPCMGHERKVSCAGSVSPLFERHVLRTLKSEGILVLTAPQSESF